MINLDLYGLIHLAFRAYWLVVLVRVIGSWVPPGNPSSPWARILGLAYALTEPLLAPLRRALAPYQRSTNFDFSPLLLLVALQIVESILLRALLR